MRRREFPDLEIDGLIPYFDQERTPISAGPRAKQVVLSGR
jgi:hypothetical protein